MKRIDPSGARLELAAGVVAERVGEGFVLIHLDSNRIFELAGTAARIFELLRSGSTAQALEDALLAEYAVEPTEIAAGVESLLAELRRQHLVV